MPRLVRLLDLSLVLGNDTYYMMPTPASGWGSKDQSVTAASEDGYKLEALKLSIKWFTYESWRC